MTTLLFTAPPQAGLHADSATHYYLTEGANRFEASWRRVECAAGVECILADWKWLPFGRDFYLAASFDTPTETLWTAMQLVRACLLFDLDRDGSLSVNDFLLWKVTAAPRGWLDAFIRPDFFSYYCAP